MHYALFKKSSGQCRLNQASAAAARSETCPGCVPTEGSTANLKPTFSWNNKQGWKVEHMPFLPLGEASVSKGTNFTTAKANHAVSSQLRLKEFLRHAF